MRTLLFPPGSEIHSRELLLWRPIRAFGPPKLPIKASEKINPITSESRVNALQLRLRLVNFNPALWAFCTGVVTWFDVRALDCRPAARLARAVNDLQYLDQVKIVILKLAALIVAATRESFAQNISIGAALGTSLTPNFHPPSMAIGLQLY